MTKLYLLLVVIIVFAGCAPHTVVNSSRLSCPDVLNRVKERNSAIQTLYGKGTIGLQSPEITSTGYFAISVKHPDSLLLIVTGPFGIHVGTLQLTKKSFTYYNGIENNVLEGTPDSSTLLSILHIQLPVEQILDAFCGAYPMVQDSLLRFASTADEYLMAFKHKGNTFEYRVDAGTYVVTSYLVKDASDKVLFQADASNFKAGSDISIPRELRISFPDDDRSIKISYFSVDLNKDVSCAFTTPQGVKIIRKHKSE